MLPTTSGRAPAAFVALMSPPIVRFRLPIDIPPDVVRTLSPRRTRSFGMRRCASSVTASNMDGPAAGALFAAGVVDAVVAGGAGTGAEAAGAGMETSTDSIGADSVAYVDPPICSRT